MKKYIKEMFNLQGLLTDKIECVNKDIIINCRSPRIYCRCPDCGKSTKKIHQYKERLIKHDRLGEKQIILKLRIRRFKCKECKKVFTEKIKGIDRKSASLNFRGEVLSWLQRNSFRYISQRFKVSGATLNRYVLEASNCWLIDWDKADVSVLGIDEHSFRGNNLVITITDISNHKLLAILKTDRQNALIEFLNSIPKKAKVRIKEVAIDLKFSYRTAVEQCLPNADIVADRFHVENMANRMVDQVRAVVQQEFKGRKGHLKKLLLTNYYLLTEEEKKKLELVWVKYEKFSKLKQSWLIKEKIVNFYRIKDYEKAKKQFKYISGLFKDTNHSCYLKSAEYTWNRWEKQILNYFNNRTTNGFTEGCHTKIKMMKRVSFGFRNIDNYIAKMMLSFLPLSILLNYISNLHTN